MLFYRGASDSDLVGLLKESDQEAFTELYHRFWKRLLAIAYKHTRDKSAAEEIVQDVFTSLWLRRAEMEIDCAEAYLATSVKFAVFKTLSRQRRRLEIQSLFKSSERSSTTEDQIDARFTSELINGFVEHLPEKCQLVFKYSRFNEMTIPEISHKMGIAEKTVEAHLTKGLKIIRLNLRNIGLFTLAASFQVLLFL